MPDVNRLQWALKTATASLALAASVSPFHGNPCEHDRAFAEANGCSSVYDVEHSTLDEMDATTGPTIGPWLRFV